MSLSLTMSGLAVRTSWSFENSQTYGSAIDSNGFNWSGSLTSGTGADQADRIYVLQSTISAGGTLSVDLAGSLTDVFGNTISFARIKVFYFELTDDTSSSGVSLGGAASNQFINWVGDATDKIKVRNGGVFFLCAPDAVAYAVTAGTGDSLLITNLDGSNVATFKLLLAGASA